MGQHVDGEVQNVVSLDRRSYYLDFVLNEIIYVGTT